MRFVWGLVGWLLLAAAGGVAAVGTGGYQSGGSGADLYPFSDGCVCYGYGLGYWVWVDGQGNFHVHQDSQSNAGHMTPPTTGPEVGFDVTSGRWVDAWGNPEQGHVTLQAGGGGGLNTPGPSEGGLVNQGFGFGEVRMRLDRTYGGHLEAHNNAAGSLLGDHVFACINADPQQGLGGVGAHVGHFASMGGFGGFPAGAYAGSCWFEPGG